MLSPLAIPAPFLLQALWESSPNGLILYQVVRDAAREPIDFRYVQVNQTAATLLGAKPEAIVGQSCQVVFPQGEALRDYYRQVARTGHSCQADYELATDGRWFEVLITYHQPDILLCFFSDKTDRQRYQRDLLEENRRLNEAQTIGKVGSFEWNLGEAIVNWSDELYRIHGLSPQANPITIDMTSQFFHPDDRLALESLQQQSFRVAGPYGLIHRSQRVDGEVVWVNHQFESIADPTGQVVRVHGTVQDITAYRQTQQQLALSVQNLQVVLDASPASIAYLKASREADGQVTNLRLAVCNQAFAQEMARSVSDLLGLSIRELDADWCGGHTWTHWLAVLETGHPFYTEQSLTVSGRWIGLAVTKHGDGIVLTGLDITTLKQAQGQYQQALLALQASTRDLQTLDKLREALRQRGELLRMSSHDLRGNISVISGAASLLAQVSSEIERVQLLTMLQRNVAYATQLLTNLLDYTRLEAAQETPKLARFDAAQLLTEWISSVQPMAEAQGLTLIHQGPADLGVMGDALKVSRMVQNLLLNAIQYTQTGGIQLAWGGGPSDHWWFSVQDTGPGLSSSVLADLTSTSSQANNRQQPPTDRPTPSSTGEGIGLRIVRLLAELLGGQLTVESQPDLGTRFVVRLPRQYLS